MSLTNSTCDGGIRARILSAVSPPSSWPAYLAGTMRSTPYGRSPICSSIHARSISSCSGVWATAPSTPMPPALLTAATTSRQWEKARIGTSMPNISVIAVRIGYLPLGARPRRPYRVTRPTVPSMPDIAVVTGANSGIGRATAIPLAVSGYEVYGTVRDPERAVKLRAMAAERGAEVREVVLDVADDESTRAGFEEILG